MRSSWFAIAAFVCLAVASSVAVVRFVESVHDSSDLQVGVRPDAVWVPVEERSYVERVDGIAHVALSAGQPLLSAEDKGGVVTRVDLSPGAAVRPGETLYSVDGVDRLALELEFPFWRDLRSGDHGSDVAQLQEILRERGHLGQDESGAGRYGSRTARAVSALREELGAQPTPQVFERRFVTNLPAGGFSVATTEISVGAPPPEVGAPLATSDETIAGVSIKNADGVDVVLPASSVPSSYSVLVNGESFPITLEGSTPRIPERLALTLSELQGDSTTGYPITFLIESNDALAFVPPTALQMSADGEGCVVVRVDGEVRASNGVTAIAFAQGRSVVVGLSNRASEVLGNPAEVELGAICA